MPAVHVEDAVHLQLQRRADVDRRAGSRRTQPPGVANVENARGDRSASRVSIRIAEDQSAGTDLGQREWAARAGVVLDDALNIQAADDRAIGLGADADVAAVG